MATNTDFPGFSPRLRDFLGDLAENNNKIWFDCQRETYREVCLARISHRVTACIAPR